MYETLRTPSQHENQFRLAVEKLSDLAIIAAFFLLLLASGLVWALYCVYSTHRVHEESMQRLTQRIAEFDHELRWARGDINKVSCELQDLREQVSGVVISKFARPDGRRPSKSPKAVRDGRCQHTQ